MQFAAHLGTVKERSSERDTTSEEKGEEITNGRQEAVSPVMRADHHESQMRMREDRMTPMELSAQVRYHYYYYYYYYSSSSSSSENENGSRRREKMPAMESELSMAGTRRHTVCDNDS